MTSSRPESLHQTMVSISASPPRAWPCGDHGETRCGLHGLNGPAEGSATNTMVAFKLVHARGRLCFAFGFGIFQGFTRPWSQ
jgi:hypothetical protein